MRPFTPHQLRHLYATHMLRGGATAELHEEHVRFAPFNGAKALPEG